MAPPLGQLYFEWLYSQVASVENKNLSRTYDKLFGIFFSKEFIWSHPRDANFAQYGIELRREFLREMPPSIARQDPGFINEPCDVLELFIALARKLSFDDLDEREPSYWYWEMVSNLGLKDFNDAKLRSKDEAYIHGVLDTFMNREYGSNGEGGLFPLRSNRKNQRREELLYQAEAYLAERV
jgi:hypothetical protein